MGDQLEGLFEVEEPPEEGKRDPGSVPSLLLPPCSSEESKEIYLLSCRGFERKEVKVKCGSTAESDRHFEIASTRYSGCLIRAGG